MSETLFDVVFHGELMPGADPATVRANLARLFKADAAKIDALFGARTVIKKSLDAATARNYEAALAKAGARVELTPTGPAVAPPAAAAAVAPAAAPRPVEPQRPNGSLATGRTASVAPATAAAGVLDARAPAPAALRPTPVAPVDVTLAEPGVVLVEAVRVAPPEFDLAGLTVAEVGALLVEPVPAVPPAYDLSTLSLDPPGAVLDVTPPPPPARIDTSALSLESR